MTNYIKTENNTFMFYPLLLYLQGQCSCCTAVAAGSYYHLKEIYPELAEGSAGWTPGTGILPMMKSMTSDFWYVGKVLANEPEEGGTKTLQGVDLWKNTEAAVIQLIMWLGCSFPWEKSGGLWIMTLVKDGVQSHVFSHSTKAIAVGPMKKPLKRPGSPGPTS